ncbi:MAG: SDR family oxidoreductase [Actinomycetota bacterium]
MRIVITGGNSGIGRAAALHLARAGHEVVATARNPDGATKLTEEIEAASLPVSLVRLDVTDDDSVQDCFELIAADHGPVDVLVNNAGIGSNFTLEDAPMDEWRGVYEANTFGPVRCTQAVLPSMRERGSGHICMISSVVGRLASIGQAVYTSSKWAMEGYSEVLALEVAPFGIDVTIVEPGVTRTAILAKNTSAPDGPYAGAYARMFAMYLSLIPDAPEADLTARVIEEAITTPDPKLRWRSGDDAEAMLAGRAQLSDEEFLQLANADDERYRELWQDWFGIDLSAGFPGPV